MADYFEGMRKRLEDYIIGTIHSLYNIDDMEVFLKSEVQKAVKEILIPLEADGFTQKDFPMCKKYFELPENLEDE